MSYIADPILIAILATAAHSMELGPSTPVSLGSSLAVGVVVIGGAFWVGRYMQRLDGRLDDIDRRLKGLELDRQEGPRV